MSAIEQLNGLALEKFTKKCDKNMRSSLLPWVRSKLPSEAFMTLPLSRLFVPLGELYADVRVAVEAVLLAGNQEAGASRGAGASGGWKPPSSFVRQTTKYWVPYDKVSDPWRFVCETVRGILCVFLDSGHGRVEVCMPRYFALLLSHF